MSDVGSFTNPVDRTTKQILLNLVEQENENMRNSEHLDNLMSTADATERTWSSLCDSYLGTNENTNVGGGDALFRVPIPIRNNRRFACDPLTASSSTMYRTSDQEIPMEMPKRMPGGGTGTGTGTGAGAGAGAGGGNLEQKKKHKKRIYKIKPKIIKNIHTNRKQKNVEQIKSGSGQAKKPTTKVKNKKLIEATQKNIEIKAKQKVVNASKTKSNNNDKLNSRNRSEIKSLSKSKIVAKVLPEAGVDKVKTIITQIKQHLNVQTKSKKETTNTKNQPKTNAEIKKTTNVSFKISQPVQSERIEKIQPISTRLEITQPISARLELVQPTIKKKSTKTLNTTKNAKNAKNAKNDDNKTGKKKRSQPKVIRASLKIATAANKESKAKEQAKNTAKLLDPIEVARVITEKIRISKENINQPNLSHAGKKTLDDLPKLSSNDLINFSTDKRPHYLANIKNYSSF